VISGEDDVNENERRVSAAGEMVDGQRGTLVADRQLADDTGDWRDIRHCV